MNKEYINDNCNETVFVIRDGENSWEAFDLAKNVIIQKLNPKVILDITHLLDNRLFKFEFDEVVATLDYSNWCGTELCISNEYGQLRVGQMRQVANEIIEIISRQPVTKN